MKKAKKKKTKTEKAQREERQKIREQVRSADPEKLLQAVKKCDGHSIFLSEGFDDLLPQSLVDRHTRVYTSDFSYPTGTIFGPDGKELKELRGVYGLSLLRAIAEAFDLDWPDSFGRGTEARNIQAAIREHFQAVKQ
jgi:hypothetical protein